MSNRSGICAKQLTRITPIAFVRKGEKPIQSAYYQIFSPKDRKLRWPKQAFFIYLNLILKKSLIILFLVLIEKFKLV